MSRRVFFAWDRGLRGPVPVVFCDSVPTLGAKPQSLLGVHEIPEAVS